MALDGAGPPAAGSSPLTIAKDDCEKNDNALACWLLADAYLEGKGVKRNAAVAADFYRRACDGGEAQGVLKSGRSLRHWPWPRPERAPGCGAPEESLPGKAMNRHAAASFRGGSLGTEVAENLLASGSRPTRRCGVFHNLPPPAHGYTA